MMEAHATLARDERTAILPPITHWNEVRRRGKLHIEKELVLQARDRSEHLVAVRHHLQVDVERAVAPPFEDRRRAAGEVHAHLAARGVADRPHEASDSI